MTEQESPVQCEHIFCYRNTYCPSRPIITCQLCGENFYTRGIYALAQKHTHIYGAHENAFVCGAWSREFQRACAARLDEIPAGRPILKFVHS